MQNDDNQYQCITTQYDENLSIYSQEIKDHNSGIDELRMTCNNPNLDLFNIKAYIQNLATNLSICSQDIDQNRNLGVNQGP